MIIKLGFLRRVVVIMSLLLAGGVVLTVIGSASVSESYSFTELLESVLTELVLGPSVLAFVLVPVHRHFAVRWRTERAWSLSAASIAAGGTLGLTFGALWGLLTGWFVGAPLFGTVVGVVYGITTGLRGGRLLDSQAG